MLFKKLNRLLVATTTAVLLIAPDAYAGIILGNDESGQSWGVGGGLRLAMHPYEAGDEPLSFVPLIYFENEYFFFDELEGGVKLVTTDQWRLSAVSSARFLDVPGKYQDLIDWNVLDFGLQLRYQPMAERYAQFDIKSDSSGRLFSNLRLGLLKRYRDLGLEPYLNFRIKSSDFNNYYYGLDQENLTAGTDFTLGLKAEYALTDHVYLVGGIEATLLDESVTDSSFVDQEWQAGLYGGIAYLSEKRPLPLTTLRSHRYLRLAHGSATPSDLHEMLTGQTEMDEHDNQMTSLFYGHPLLIRAFDLPLDFYVTPGFVWHWSSDTQSTAQEYVLGLKLYYGFNWPLRWRFGLAEGLSYVTDPTHIEKSELDRNDYEASNLMIYLDVTLDLELGSLFDSLALRDVWLGYSIHHRSGMFEASSLFGRVKGGSNYQTLYLQWGF